MIGLSTQSAAPGYSNNSTISSLFHEFVYLSMGLGISLAHRNNHTIKLRK
jgi:hypothetical protein